MIGRRAARRLRPVLRRHARAKPCIALGSKHLGRKLGLGQNDPEILVVPLSPPLARRCACKPNHDNA
jgi:hypothetical protein